MRAFFMTVLFGLSDLEKKLMIVVLVVQHIVQPIVESPQAQQLERKHIFFDQKVKNTLHRSRDRLKLFLKILLAQPVHYTRKQYSLDCIFNLPPSIRTLLLDHPPVRILVVKTVRAWVECAARLGEVETLVFEKLFVVFYCVQNWVSEELAVASDALLAFDLLWCVYLYLYQSSLFFLSFGFWYPFVQACHRLAWSLAECMLLLFRHPFWQASIIFLLLRVVFLFFLKVFLLFFLHF